MRFYRRYIFCLFATLILLQYSPAQVVINEFSCSNIDIVQDNYGENEDWIELYNSGTNAIDLSGFYLSDKDSKPEKWQFQNASIPAGGFLIVWASGNNIEVAGNYHTNFKLTQSKQEYIILSDPNSNIVDSLKISHNTKRDHSFGRRTDGGNQWGVFINPTPGSSNGNSYVAYTQKVEFDHDPGYYANAIEVALLCGDPTAQIYYTLDGSNPTASSPLYATPLYITATTVIKATAVSSDPDYLPGITETNTYFIGQDHHSVYVVSIAGDDVPTLLGGNSWVKPEGSFELFDFDQTFLYEATGEYNKHGNDSWAYQQRGVDYITRDQFGVDYTIKHQIFRDKDRDKFQRLILKAAANDNYPFEDGAHIRDSYVHSLSIMAELKLDERTFEPCVLYVNGQYWGVYDIREKADDSDYTDYYYDQDEPYIQYLKTWGGTWEEYGAGQAQNAWDQLQNFIMTNDMTIQANFDTVSKYYNWKSLIDYIVLNSYTVCSDWLNWNTAWWRGMDPEGDKKKWRYVLWDMDATFGHYINYTGVPNTSPQADPCNPEQLGDPGGQGHIPVLNQLSQNEVFVQYYQSRFIDLANTFFSCDFMLSHLDSLIDLIDPEMPRQIAKWGGSYSDWQAKVQELRDFITQKCAAFADGMINCYSLTGPFNITILVEPPESGNVKINSLNLKDFGYPYMGSYFGNIETILKAMPEDSYVFDYWQINNNSLVPNSNTDIVTVDFQSGDTIIAHFIKPYPQVNFGNDTTLCLGQSLVLDAFNTNSTYSWNTGNTNSSITVSDQGTYSVIVDNGLYIGGDTIFVEFYEAPQIDLGNDTTICPGEVIILYANTNAENYEWQDGSTNDYFEVSELGTYWLYSSNFCGTDYDSVIVSEGTLPKINIGENQTILPGEVIYLDAYFGTNASYLWQDNSASAYFTVTEPGTYWVKVTNFCGSVTDIIHIEYEINIDIPEAFSPNEDGLNDEFLIKSASILNEDFHLVVFNRWGEEVFKSNSKENSWDGKSMNREEAPSGVYPFVLKYTDIAGNKQYFEGTIVLIR